MDKQKYLSMSNMLLAYVLAKTTEHKLLAPNLFDERLTKVTDLVKRDHKGAVRDKVCEFLIAIDEGYRRYSHSGVRNIHPYPFTKSTDAFEHAMAHAFIMHLFVHQEATEKVLMGKNLDKFIHQRDVVFPMDSFDYLDAFNEERRGLLKELSG